MRLRSVLVGILAVAYSMPAAAQLAVTAQVQVEGTAKRDAHKVAFSDFYTRWLMGVETRRTKQVLEVKTYVLDGVVRVEGLAPLRGWPDHLVLISRGGDGKDVWLDPV